MKDQVDKLDEPGVAASQVNSGLTAREAAETTPAVVHDILARLDIRDANVIKSGTYRPNLQFGVLRTTNDTEKESALVRLLREADGTGIIYTATVRPGDRDATANRPGASC